MKLFDSHCHLQLEQYDADRQEVLARMEERGIGAVLIGTDLKESKDGVELARQHDFLWAAVGLHPTSTEDFDISKFRDLAQQPKVVAVGECGLDYFRSGGTEEERAVQKDKFGAQIALAAKLNKALVVHCRNAHEDCSSILQNTGIANKVPVVIHFFTGNGELAQQYLDLGCYLSFPGPITYTEMYDVSIRVCPLERMLIETDSPFAAPVPNRGKRNEPSYVEHVAAKIAQVKGLLPEEVAARTLQNAKTVFGLHD